jgi:hypothetical protein
MAEERLAGPFTSGSNLTRLVDLSLATKRCSLVCIRRVIYGKYDRLNLHFPHS